MKKLAVKQRDSLADMAADAKISSAPEARVGKLTNSGKLKMRFTQPIKIPADAETRIRQQTKENRRRLAIGEAPEEKILIQVYAVKDYIPDEDEIADVGLPIMDGWALVSLTADGFDLDLNFTDPLRVSSGDEPDLLLIQLNLGDFEDSEGNKLPESVVKYAPIPT